MSAAPATLGAGRVEPLPAERVPGCRAGPADSVAERPRRGAEDVVELLLGEDESADPDDPADPVESAKATGNAPAIDPTPKATARAPTRPTCQTLPPGAPDPVAARRATSIARTARLVRPKRVESVMRSIHSPGKQR